MRSRGRWCRVRGGWRDLIEAGLNEAAVERALWKKCLPHGHDRDLTAGNGSRRRVDCGARRWGIGREDRGAGVGIAVISLQERDGSRSGIAQGETGVAHEQRGGGVRKLCHDVSQKNACWRPGGRGTIAMRRMRPPQSGQVGTASERVCSSLA